MTVTTNQILEEVEKRVAEKLPSRLIEAITIQHAKHGWRSMCECNVCAARRSYTRLIGISKSFARQDLITRKRENIQILIEGSDITGI